MVILFSKNIKLRGIYYDEKKKGYGDKETVCETNGTGGLQGWRVNCKGKGEGEVRSKRRNNILTFNTRVEYLLSKLLLLPE
ncbi:hypothetical protein, partial [Peribacillus simplex]|uniref:hypothetical protein n=1 Tax=Peribacillus simplex TaxID=1478 RepID=UPI001C87FC44